MPASSLSDRRLRRRVAALCAASFALPMFAGAARPEELLQVSDAWVTPSRPGQTVVGGYMRLRSAQDAALVQIETDAAAKAEMHQMSMENDIMRMRRLDRLELPAGRTVDLAPGARHLMLFDVRRPLKAGDTVALTLTLRLADGKSVHRTVNAQVRAVSPGKDEAPRTGRAP